MGNGARPITLSGTGRREATDRQLRQFPPRQKAASFNLDSVMESLGPAIAREKTKEAKEAASEKQKPELAGVKAS